MLVDIVYECILINIAAVFFFSLYLKKQPKKQTKTNSWVSLVLVFPICCCCQSKI